MFAEDLDDLLRRAAGGGHFDDGPACSHQFRVGPVECLTQAVTLLLGSIQGLPFSGKLLLQVGYHLLRACALPGTPVELLLTALDRDTAPGRYRLLPGLQLPVFL